MNISIFGAFGWKTPINAPKIVLGYLIPKLAAISTKAKKAHPCASLQFLRHQA